MNRTRIAWAALVLGVIIAGCAAPSEPESKSAAPTTDSKTAAAPTEETKPEESKEQTEYQVKDGWTDNLAQARAEAKTGNKLVLMDFTGSDWCSPCKLMQKEVFGTPEFKEWAAKRASLLMLDYPQAYTPPADIVKQNEKLVEQYKIQGYPTVVFTDAAGKEVARFEQYESMTVQEWIAMVEAKLPKG